jgi:purine-binding chemotaxis protein CheW
MREYRITHKTGMLTWLQEWSQIVCDENGEVEYVTGILVDITELKKDEFVRLKYEERTGKYLTFSLACEEYGISIVKVKEIIELMPITPIPQAPPFVKGVINLRGKVIPVIDLRIRFGMAPVEHSDRSCIIVVDIAGAAGTRLVGVMVDSVSDVLYISGYDIEDPPAFISTFETDYLLGMAKTEKSLKIILDIDQVLSGMDLTHIAPDAG